MQDLNDKQVLVAGLGARGRAACELLRRGGAYVMAMDEADTPELRTEVARLKTLGVEVELDASKVPDRQFSMAVVSPAIRANSLLMAQLSKRDIPVIGELEFGYQQSRCLSIAITGTNGKGTTAEMIESMATLAGRKTVACGHGGRPICDVAPSSRELDFMTLQVNAFQLETTTYFRPVVAVLLNTAADHLDRYRSQEEYIRTLARIFMNQQAFDWAIIQSEALEKLKELKLEIPSKIVTFSATDKEADIYLDRGLLTSRMPQWSGPLLDTAECALQGTHNAENMMAALAVGRALRMNLEEMAAALKKQAPSPHRFELVGEINGVKYINDSKGTNVDALKKALVSCAGRKNQPNIWLIAGGKDAGLDFHEVGPLVSERVKGAILIGEAREKIRAAWSLFTPCALSDSLLEAVSVAAKKAAPGDVILFSPACSSFDQFLNYQHRGEVYLDAVKRLATTITGGTIPGGHNFSSENRAEMPEKREKRKDFDLPRGFLRKNPGAKRPHTNTKNNENERTLSSATAP